MTKEKMIEKLKKEQQFDLSLKYNMKELFCKNADQIISSAETANKNDDLDDLIDIGLDIVKLYRMATDKTLKEYAEICPNCEEWFEELIYHEGEDKLFCDECVTLVDEPDYMTAAHNHRES